MEALRSAEALQVHWEAAHSKPEGGGARANVDGASATPPAKRYINNIISFAKCDFPVRDLIAKKPVSIDQYIPTLPSEGAEDELDQYRTLAQEMIVLINVCRRHVTRHVTHLIGGKVSQWRVEVSGR